MQESLLLKVMADTTRIKILSLLVDGEKCVCEIFPAVDKSQPNVSLHLKLMEKEKILASRREGKKIIYKIVDYRVCQILKILGDKRIDQYGQSCCEVKR